MRVAVKRVYEKAASTDGVRVLVDRDWPRGLGKGTADIDVWLRDLAPTDRLNKWFGQDPGKWQEFKGRYAKQLVGRDDLIDDLMGRARRRKVTLLFSSRERHFNNAVALKEYLEEKMRR